MPTPDVPPEVLAAARAATSDLDRGPQSGRVRQCDLNHTEAGRGARQIQTIGLSYESAGSHR